VRHSSYQHASAPWRAAALTALALLASGCAPGELEPPEETPAPGPPRVTVSGPPAPPGADITVHADGFSPFAPAEIGFGMPDSDYEVIARVRTDRDGAISLLVTVPEWAMMGQRYVVVVNERRRRAVSEPFLVE